MKKTKVMSAKRSFFMSVLSLILCFAMLLGTTWAWFTDSVTSGVNKIVAGNLDVELYHKNAAVTADDVKVDANTQLFNAASNGILWEPGAVSYEVFTVKNVGTLALKYKLNAILADFVGDNGSTIQYNTVVNADNSATTYSLLDVLRVAEVEGDSAPSARPAYTAADGVTLGDYLSADHYAASALEPGASKSTTIVIFWPESANDNNWNLQNGKYASDSNATDVGSLKVGLAISLVATQQTSESDSFDNQYDATADNSYAANTVVVATVKATATAEEAANGLTLSNNNKASAEISADDVKENYAYILTIETKESDTATTAVAVGDGEAATYYEVNVTEIIGDNSSSSFTNPVKITMNVGAGLVDVVAYHNGVAMTADPTLAGTDQTYCYNPTTGVLTLFSKDFSPFAIKYKIPVTSVSLPAEAAAYVGSTTPLTATILPANAFNKFVTWTTSDASVATVNDGVVTGVAEGTATITATTIDAPAASTVSKL